MGVVEPRDDPLPPVLGCRQIKTFMNKLLPCTATALYRSRTSLLSFSDHVVFWFGLLRWRSATGKAVVDRVPSGLGTPYVLSSVLLLSPDCLANRRAFLVRLGFVCLQRKKSSSHMTAELNGCIYHSLQRGFVQTIIIGCHLCSSVTRVIAAAAPCGDSHNFYVADSHIHTTPTSTS